MKENEWNTNNVKLVRFSKNLQISLSIPKSLFGAQIISSSSHRCLHRWAETFIGTSLGFPFKKKSLSHQTASLLKRASKPHLHRPTGSILLLGTQTLNSLNILLHSRANLSFKTKTFPLFWPSAHYSDSSQRGAQQIVLNWRISKWKKWMNEFMK